MTQAWVVSQFEIQSSENHLAALALMDSIAKRLQDPDGVQRRNTPSMSTVVDVTVTAMPESHNPKIEFHFTTAPGYRVFAMNGAWVGITPRGDLRVEFFVESAPVPKVIVNALDEKGRLGAVLSAEPPSEPIAAVRELQAGILLNMREARAVAELILEKVKVWEEANGASGQ